MSMTWAAIDSPDAIPISCGSILSYLKQHGFSGTILGDYSGSPLTPRALAAALETRQPAVLEFSVYEENIDRIRTLASFAKYVKYDILVILSGSQVTFMPDDARVKMMAAQVR